MKKINLIYTTFWTCFILFTIAILAIVDKEPQNTSIFIVIYVIGIILIVSFLTFNLRNELIMNSKKNCEFIEEVIEKRGKAEFNTYDETLFSKEQSKLKELVNVLENERQSYEKEKESIQVLVSDISHQIKTPLANLSMYNATLRERELDRETQGEFLQDMDGQIQKLHWLIQSLIKMSRLETEVIKLNKSISSIEDTIGIALGGIYLIAEKKGLNISFNCDSKIRILHDKKWTSEAIFNILENAVKYTENKGDIVINVEKMEFFTRITISDTGIGIEENEINNIFQRFYRSTEVADYEGVGVGLYLSREIINRQGGYITVNSVKNEGSSFNIFLLNELD